MNPDDVSPVALHNWAAERMLPLAPSPDGPMTGGQWSDADRYWRRDLERAVERIRHDLAKLLRHAGHAIPDPGIRSLDRYSADPVVMTWIDLADTDPPESRARYSVFEQFPVPRLALGVTALHDLNDEDAGER